MLSFMNEKAIEQFKKELHKRQKSWQTTSRSPSTPFLDKLINCYMQIRRVRDTRQSFYIWVTEATSEDLLSEFNEHEVMELFR